MKLTLAIVFICFVMSMVSCFGPRTETSKVTLHSPARVGEPYQVDALITNEGSGQGQVDVRARIRDVRNQATFQQSQMIDLKAHESVHVIFKIDAPAAEYQAEVSATYPPGLK